MNNRYTQETIEQLGCTDLRQQWGQIEKKVNEAYKTEPFNSFCHGEQFQSDKKYHKTPEDKIKILSILCQADFGSELSIHSRAYRASLKSEIRKHSVTVRARVLKKLQPNELNITPKICDLNPLFSLQESIFGKNYDAEIDKIINFNLSNTHLKEFSIKIYSKEEALFFNKKVKVNTEKAKKNFNVNCKTE